MSHKKNGAWVGERLGRTLVDFSYCSSVHSCISYFYFYVCKFLPFCLWSKCDAHSFVSSFFSFAYCKRHFMHSDVWSLFFILGHQCFLLTMSSTPLSTLSTNSLLSSYCGILSQFGSSAFCFNFFFTFAYGFFLLFLIWCHSLSWLPSMV